jgi:hypothetical protein
MKRDEQEIGKRKRRILNYKKVDNELRAKLLNMVIMTSFSIIFRLHNKNIYSKMHQRS